MKVLLWTWKKTQEIKIKYQYKEIQIIIYYKIQSHTPTNLQFSFNNYIPL
jgi:hypothetical protein